MTFGVKIPTVIGIIAIVLLTSPSATQTNNENFMASLESFNQNLFTELVHSNDSKNIIYSPLSIHSSLTMTRMGANGETAVEMDDVLGFTAQTPESVSNKYHTLLAKYTDSQILQIANKMYAMKDYELQDNYKKLLVTKFFSSAENIDFSRNEKAADNINAWVEMKTNCTIKNLVDPHSLGNDVKFLLLSAIHFNGKWATAFPKEDTSEKDFHTNENHTVKIPMMYRNGQFEYGIDRELNANILRLPYNGSDLAMVILVPRFRFGLAELLNKLKNFQFQSWRGKRIYWQNDCGVYLPKFKVEFEIELRDPLKRMGINHMFGDADFGKMFKSHANVYVSNVIHKAAIEVSEEGTEAAAATDVEGLMRMDSLTVNIDQPFVYAIVNEDFIPLFQGTFTGH